MPLDMFHIQHALYTEPKLLKNCLTRLRAKAGLCIRNTTEVHRKKRISWLITLWVMVWCAYVSG